MNQALLFALLVASARGSAIQRHNADLSSRVRRAASPYDEIDSWIGSVPDDTEKQRSGDVQKMLADVGKYISVHKWIGFDRRKERTDGIINETFASSFPTPPLVEIHKEILANCRKSIFECIQVVYLAAAEYLESVDSPNPRHPEKNSTSSMIETHDPFKSVLEDFNFRTSASYFLCYFTLQRVPVFRHFDCKKSRFREDFIDYRAEYNVPYGCAELSFCPETCCSKPSVSPDVFGTCLRSKGHDSENFCSRNNRGSMCRTVPFLNENFKDLALNAINVTCSGHD
ncbi:hypothetical protein CAPTEDRAFT_213684 [Capitella teleta]|uniref:Uncharacterized protein n=1 Tax=Capitella teleta TaxID=283909 RepID=R7V7T3_CAPTE|nr:hypothetical protein CAPTEDRAFT_213684 [Capitella teleta]|eukprot:ELU14918.1 hypothetical protein CAPTEDRAFT_213684 [Capitella teleta]